MTCPSCGASSRHEHTAGCSFDSLGSQYCHLDTIHELALALDLLRDIQWFGWGNEENPHACPACGAFVKDKGHHPGCRLAAMIGAKVGA